MKPKRHITILAAAAFLLFAAISCSKTDGDGQPAQHEHIEFRLDGEPPVAGYPQSNVGYNFEISYSGGIASVVTTIDGIEVEDSFVGYEECPEKVSYSFRYTLAASQAGQTVDFVFTATGADGWTESIDYPVYVYAKQADIEIVLPDDLPEEWFTDEPLAFTVGIKSNLIDLMRIRTLKGIYVIDSLTKTEGFTTPRSDDYRFAYVPQPSDTGQNVTFTFEVTDAEGNLISANWTVKFVSKPIEGIREFYGITLGFQRNTVYGQFLNAVTGTVYPLSEGYEHCEDIDIALFWSGNAGTVGMAVCAPNTSNASTVYNQATVDILGGDSNDVITNWPTRKATLFKTTNLTANDFAMIDSVDALRAAYEDCETAASGLANQLTAEGMVVAFKTIEDLCGLLKVVNKGSGNQTYAVIDYLMEEPEQ